MDNLQIQDPSLHFSILNCPIFCRVKFIGQLIRNGKRREIARDIFKNIFVFKILHKMVTKLGQFKKLK